MTRMLFVRLSVIRLLPVLQITFQQTDNYLFFFFRPARQNAGGYYRCSLSSSAVCLSPDKPAEQL